MNRRTIISPTNAESTPPTTSMIASESFGVPAGSGDELAVAEADAVGELLADAEALGLGLAAVR